MTAYYTSTEEKWLGESAEKSAASPVRAVREVTSVELAADDPYWLTHMHVATGYDAPDGD